MVENKIFSDLAGHISLIPDQHIVTTEALATTLRDQFPNASEVQIAAAVGAAEGFHMIAVEEGIVDEQWIRLCGQGIRTILYS